MNNDLEFLFLGIGLIVVGMLLTDYAIVIGLTVSFFGGLIAGSSANGVWNKLNG